MQRRALFMVRPSVSKNLFGSAYLQNAQRKQIIRTDLRLRRSGSDYFCLPCAGKKDDLASEAFAFTKSKPGEAGSIGKSEARNRADGVFAKTGPRAGGAFAPSQAFCAAKPWRRANSLRPSIEITLGVETAQAVGTQKARHDFHRVSLFGADDGTRTRTAMSH